MTGNTPAISVIMPVYNGAPWVAESIQCILDQTFADFELIIINDGSKDNSEQVIRTFTDPRIRLVTQANQGLANTLNNGVALARAQWIARQDQDDISLPERFAEQLAFLREHPEVGLLGTWATITDSKGTPIGALEHPVEDERIRYALLFDSPFVHASVMFSRSAFDAVKGYDPDPALFEDFDMWSRMIQHTRGANIPEHLVRYREVSTSISRVTTTRLDRVAEQRRRNMRIAFPGVPADLLAAMSELGLRHVHVTVKQFLAVRQHLAGYIRKTMRTPAASKELQERLRRAMPGYRLIEHRSFFHRVADRALKEFLLFWSDFR